MNDQNEQQPILRICHLYPDEMNLYGDYGNIIALKKRAEWMGIKTVVTNIGIGDTLVSDDFDLFFMGGGMDIDQIDVFEDLKENKKDEIKKAVEQEKVFLLVCGAYQLFGKYFLTVDNQRIEGLGILGIETIGGNERCIGNISVKTEIDGEEVTLVGFENHSGQTFLDKDTTPFAIVEKGFGNNTKDNYEGVRYKNVIGTYMHGSFLPKNPEVADYLIKLSIGHSDKQIVLTNLPSKKEELEAKTAIVTSL